VVARWAEQTPAGFRFAIKMWRGITHYRKLHNCADFIEEFLDLVDPIPSSRRAPMLVQLPGNFSSDPERLAGFLADLRAVQSARPAGRWRMAFEFRHDSWYTPDIYRLLDRHRAALCLHDMAGRGAVDRPNDAPFIYLRRHGPGARYASNYPPEMIERDASKVREWLAQSKQVWVYYNNDVGACAVRNAAELLAALGASPMARYAAGSAASSKNSARPARTHSAA
jgi:uncharacterized protein YecE (DUF72 family)